MAKPIVTKGHLLNGARGRQAIRKLPAAALRRRGMPSDLVIYESIAAAIFEQRLPPSTKLTEETLGAIFGVSRTIVRNALLRLAHDKIVEIRPIAARWWRARRPRRRSRCSRPAAWSRRRSSRAPPR